MLSIKPLVDISTRRGRGGGQGSAPARRRCSGSATRWPTPAASSGSASCHGEAPDVDEFLDLLAPKFDPATTIGIALIGADDRHPRRPARHRRHLARPPDLSRPPPAPASRVALPWPTVTGPVRRSVRRASAPRTGRIAGRYRLDRPIASGGMAQVWEATDEVLDPPVAVKLLHPHLAADDTFVARFRAEAVAAARLAHPAIVSIYDTCSGDGIEAIVMELVAGTTLRAPDSTERAPARRSTRPSASPPRWPTRSRPPTGPGSSTATSSRPTSSCPPTAGCWSPTSASPRPPRAPTSRPTGRWSAPPSTWPPSRSRASRSTAAPTSTPSASSSTRCCAAGRRSRPTPTPPPRWPASTATPMRPRRCGPASRRGSSARSSTASSATRPRGPAPPPRCAAASPSRDASPHRRAGTGGDGRGGDVTGDAGRSRRPSARARGRRAARAAVPPTRTAPALADRRAARRQPRIVAAVLATGHQPGVATMPAAEPITIAVHAGLRPRGRPAGRRARRGGAARRRRRRATAWTTETYRDPAVLGKRGRRSGRPVRRAGAHRRPAGHLRRARTGRRRSTSPTAEAGADLGAWGDRSRPPRASGPPVASFAIDGRRAARRAHLDHPHGRRRPGRASPRCRPRADRPVHGPPGYAPTRRGRAG